MTYQVVNVFSPVEVDCCIVKNIISLCSVWVEETRLRVYYYRETVFPKLYTSLAISVTNIS